MTITGRGFPQGFHDHPEDDRPAGKPPFVAGAFITDSGVTLSVYCRLGDAHTLVHRTDSTTFPGLLHVDYDQDGEVIGVEILGVRAITHHPEGPGILEGPADDDD